MSGPGQGGSLWCGPCCLFFSLHFVSPREGMSIVFLWNPIHANGQRRGRPLVMWSLPHVCARRVEGVISLHPWMTGFAHDSLSTRTERRWQELQEKQCVPFSRGGAGWWGDGGSSPERLPLPWITEGCCRSGPPRPACNPLTHGWGKSVTTPTTEISGMGPMLLESSGWGAGVKKTKSLGKNSLDWVSKPDTVLVLTVARVGGVGGVVSLQPLLTATHRAPGRRQRAAPPPPHGSPQLWALFV